MLNESKDFSIDFLKERAKELESLYKVDEILCKDSREDVDRKSTRLNSSHT